MDDALTVIIADDHPLFRKGVADVIRSDASVVLVAQAADGEEAERMIALHRPDAAILDVDMPKRNGLDVAKAARISSPGTALVLLTMYAGADMLQRALSFGVRGYVSKESAADDILACLHLVVAGRTYVSASLGAPVAAPSTPSLSATWALQLTASERNVLKLVGRNMTTREIAESLGITPKTAEHHRSNICQKLGVTGNNALVRFALEHAAELQTL